MLPFSGSFCVFVCSCVSRLFGFVLGYFLRFLADEESGKHDPKPEVEIFRQENETGSECFEGFDGFEEKEKPEFTSGLIRKDSTEDSVFTENSSTAIANKYQFLRRKDFTGFVEELETMSFVVQELHASSIGSFNQVLDTGTPADKDFWELNLQAEAVKQKDSAGKCFIAFELEPEVENPADADGSAGSEEAQELDPETEVINTEIAVNSTDRDFEEFELGTDGTKEAKAEDSAEDFESVAAAADLEKAENLAVIVHGEDGTEGAEEMTITEHKGFEKQGLIGLQNKFLGEHDVPEDVSSLWGNCLSIGNRDEFLTSNHKIDPINDELLPETECGEGHEPKCPDHGYIELEPYLQDFEENLSGKDLHKAEGKHQDNEDLESKEDQQIDDLENSENPCLPEKSWVDSDDQMELEMLWEHKDLIDQLKLELRRVRTRGLPTILEESESPKVAEDLKPLKIDEKIDLKDRIEEIQKFYKSYKEKMQKLDILNYQTLHAIGLLQLKDQICQKPPTIRAILLQNFRQCRPQRISETDPTQKVITELQRDLEMVYVGQVCLSWEILHWQFRKALELQEFDSHGFRQYNHVADEFQQFQVLVQRFVENEPFQCQPRVQNYVKKRCVLRSLLHVPAIKDDCFKDKKGRREKGEDAFLISSAMLTEIIEESMHVFWEFLRADKDEANVILKGLQGTQIELQEPADYELLMDVRKILQKNQKRLKDLLRTGNCIVKKFQKHREGRVDHAMFIAQIEMRLVSRVLSMSRLTTDQLVWCFKKLKKITFVNRKLHMETSFLLFPC
ncbi:uncharacterized protein LOC131144996 [Malania oleifera]|uniref:uncharacterized protein LOC131144996 n=1 Tax=Malania oleifera TaxID=397392 RepID=UPI0025AE4C7C|nr:uncharacterized protein LOC131144996 [Malania oleifera]